MKDLLKSQTADAPRTVSRSAVNFFLGTACSRSLGFFREMALGAWFGAGPALAAFFVAYRFSQLLRRLFGEGSLLSSFSPHFEELRAQSPEKAAQFFRDLFVSLSFFLGVLILVLESALFTYWKWGGASSNTQDILLLTMVMLPGVLFVCLYALFAALLQSDRKYFLPSAAPIFFNLVFIGVLWIVKEWSPYVATFAIGVGVVFAFLMQWIAVAMGTKPFLKTIRWEGIRLWTPELKKMVSAMTLSIIGVGSVQLNSFADTLFARSADLAGPAYLYYAMRLYQLPLALFGIALSSALLPPLARAIQSGDRKHFLSLLQFASRKCLFLMIPVSIAILSFGESGVNLVYGRGAFDTAAIFETTRCFWGYGLGAFPSALILLLAPAFYAQKDFRTPLNASLFSVAMNLCLNGLFVFVFHLGSASVALATSIAAFGNALYLFRALAKQDEPVLDKKTKAVFKKVLGCATLAGLMTLLVGYFLVEGTSAGLLLGDGVAVSLPRNLVAQLTRVVIYGGVFGLFFLSYVWMGKRRGSD